MAGQAHHFREFAKEKVPYGIKRYTDEVNRLYGVLEHQLRKHEFIAGDYSIADMACWPWIVHHAWQGQSLEDFPAVKRWHEAVGARPAVKRAMLHGRVRHSDEVGDTHLYGQTAATVDGHRRRHAGEADPATGEK
jgi:glutathione S-transferase